MISWKLVGIGLVPLAGGVGIAYPAINSFNSNVNIKLESLEDFKQHCWVSISGGDKGRSGETNKKLLVCPTSYSTSKSEASFYLYNESEKDKLPREVESLKREITDESENIIIYLKKDNSDTTQNSEVISVSNWQWRELYNPERNLKQGCTLDWKNSQKIICGDKVIRPELTPFK